MAYLPTGRSLIDPFIALEKAGIREEMRVADFGVGPVGHFLFPAAKLVGPKGRVYGVDVMKSVLESIHSRVKLAGSDNIEMVWGDFERPGGSRLPDHSMDMVAMISVLHSVNMPSALTEAKRVLATGGILLAIEWKAAGTLIGPPPQKRVLRDDVVVACEQAGFQLVKEFEAGPSHYGLVLKKA
jgi:ubiquinone/menaquinone biosynthesis C-methylase UbiE